MSGLSASQIRAIVEEIHRRFDGVQAIWLFGSAARAEMTPRSDVDLAILLAHDELHKHGSLMMTQGHLALQKMLGRGVDLLNLRRVSTVVQNEVVSEGALIDRADPYAVDEFEMLVASFWQQLNYERRGLLEDLRTTGKAYSV